MWKFRTRLVTFVLSGLAYAPCMAAEEVSEWFVYSEIDVLPAPIASGKLHRLGNESAQSDLAYTAHGAGIGLVWASVNPKTLTPNSKPNISIQRFVEDPSAPDSVIVDQNVHLNERVAIYVEPRGYLVQQGHEGLHLAWRERATLFDIYQWEFRSVSRQVYDHRKRVINTKETLALYNTVAKQYLVYKGNGQGLGLNWRPAPR